MVQEVAIMVSQVNERGAEAAHAAQGEHNAHTAAPADTAPLQFLFCTTYMLQFGISDQISNYQ